MRPQVFSPAVQRHALIWKNGPFEGQCFTLAPGKIAVLGSHPEADFYLPAHEVAEKHCRLECEEGGIRLVDTSGTRGSLVNGKQVSSCELQPGDILRIGSWSAEVGKAEIGPLYGGSCDRCLRGLREFEGLGKPTAAVGERRFCPSCFDRRLEVDRHLGDYKILRKANRSSKEVLYIAEHVTQKAKVALKIMRSNLLMDRRGIREFLKRTTDSLRFLHPHLIRVHEVRRYKGSYFVVMENIEGRCIFDHMKKRRLSQVEDSLRLALQTCSALSYLYEHGVAAGLMMPRDIYLVRGNIKLQDFWLFPEKPSRGSTSTRGLHVKRQYMPFLPPEFFAAQGQLDQRSDIYMVGALIYQMLTGEPPFAAKRLSSLIKKIEQSAPVAPRELRPELSESLDAAILQSLEKAPDDRFAAMSDFVAALKKAARESFS